MNTCACKFCANLAWIDVLRTEQYREVLDISLPRQERSAYTTTGYEKSIANSRTSSSINNLQIPTHSLFTTIDNILENSAECEKKQKLGEVLFPLVQQLQFALAGKITGMLLELENDEIRRLIMTPECLNDKVDEAVALLQAHMAKHWYEAKLATRLVRYEPPPPFPVPLAATSLGAYVRLRRPTQKSKQYNN